MNNLLLIITCLLLLILTSCDGRKSKIDHIKNAVSEFNKNQKLVDVINYYPDRYTEIKTDSIVANIFKVSVKNYALMDNEIFVNASIENLKKTINYHRVFESEILVLVEDKIIYSEHLSIEKFRDDTSEFWENATLEHVWVNQENSTKIEISLGVSLINPKTNSYKLYEILIDKFGNERLELIEEHS